MKALRLTFKATSDRLILEGDRPGAAHRLCEQLSGTDEKPGRVEPRSVYVTQAQIRVEYAALAGKSVRPRDIRITWPNTCNLGQDARDEVLREMLIRTGIDPESIGRDSVP